MRRFLSKTRLLGCVLGVVLLVSGCAEPKRPITQPSQLAGQTRYFFVVPQKMPDGTTARRQRDELEKWLATKAHGYTRLGPCQGGWVSGRDLIKEDNIAYFVVGPDGLKPGIERIILEQFNQQQAFAVQW